MPQDTQGRSAEENLFRELINIVGADAEKLASARGREIAQPTLDEELKDLFPGLQKIASLQQMSIPEMLKDPNFNAGLKFELDKTAAEWVPLARQLLGLE